jgi:ribosomal protein S18 acetylase RimI-like enzyme
VPEAAAKTAATFFQPTAARCHDHKLERNFLTQIIYRAVETADCNALVALHLRSFTPWEIETSTFASPRVENYLRAVTSVPLALREQFLWGAWRGEEIIGYAFGRALPDAWHLNYLTVAQEERNRGIGDALWKLWKGAGQDRELKKQTLDMWQTNENARSWYEHKGCRVAAQTWFYRRALKTGDGAPEAFQSLNWQLLNWENAVAWQAQYGFSRFEIARAQSRWAIGRLGEELFRAMEILPGAVETALHSLEASRSLLLGLPQPSPHETADNILLRLESAS